MNSSLPAAVLLLAAASSAADVPVPPALRNVSIVEHLRARIPLGLPFADAAGAPVILGDEFSAGTPVILSLVYFRCPMLCSLVLAGLAGAMRHLDWRLGRDYRAVTVSIDPADRPAEAAIRQAMSLRAAGLDPRARGWAFLTGKESAIDALTRAVGFRDRYDPASHDYAHPAAIFVLTPRGRISRYLYGIEYPPLQLKLALLEAGAGRSGASFERILLQCYHYDPSLHRYGLFVAGLLRAGGCLTLLLALALFGMTLRSRKGRQT